MMRTRYARAAVTALTGLLAAGTAAAGTIIGAVDATIDEGGPGLGTLVETYDQSGLDTAYVSGVTDFDAYIAADPLHTAAFDGFEWVSELGRTEAVVTYDLGMIYTIDALALWNEDATGIGVLDLLVSTDGVSFTDVAQGLVPTDNPIGVPYGADVFGFSPVAAQFVRFDISRCPQNDFPSCSIGEVAFRGGGTAGVPSPSPLMLLGAGAVAAAVARRRR